MHTTKDIRHPRKGRLTSDSNNIMNIPFAIRQKSFQLYDSSPTFLWLLRDVGCLLSCACESNFRCGENVQDYVHPSIGIFARDVIKTQFHRKVISDGQDIHITATWER